MIATCRDYGADSYATYCTVLTAYAESDFKWDAKSKNPTKSGYYSEGVFQQTLPWWPHDHFDVVASTRAFLNAFRRKTGNPIKDAWYVQFWAAPDPQLDVEGFLAAVETQNYSRRLTAVNQMIATGKLA